MENIRIGPPNKYLNNLDKENLTFLSNSNKNSERKSWYAASKTIVGNKFSNYYLKVDYKIPLDQENISKNMSKIRIISKDGLFLFINNNIINF